MPDTPTQEGSIVAYLRLDDSDWKAKLDEAEARARELGRVDPTIKVNADTAEAIAKLEEVKALEAGAGGTVTTTTVSRNESTGSSVAADAAAKVDAVTAATKRLQAAEQGADTAYARAQIAAMRLEQTESKRGRTELQVAQAVLANTEAQNRLNAANEKAIAAEDALAAAQRKAALAAVEQAAAELAAADGTNAQSDAAGKAAAANKGNAGYMGMVVAAVAALIPLAGPLAGTFSAITGSVMGMGAAGVLAVLGIKNAMTAGTAAGDDYSAGLHTLKGDLDQLSQTSAVSMMEHFNTAITTIDESMPSLNSEISRFSSMLGTAGNIVLHALVTGFQVLNPLFVQAGVFIEQIATGFDKWTNNGGLATFAQDALTSMPQVTQALGSLLAMTMHLIGALAPLGGVMLFVITAAANLANVLLGVLQPPIVLIATAALAVWGAFQLWGSIGPIVQSAYESVALMGMYTVEAVGAVGLLAAAAAAVTVVIVGWNAVMDAQKAFAQQGALAVQDYTAAVTADSGAIKENTLAMIAKNLHDSGAIENAHKLGISTQTLVGAILGHKDALDQVTLATANYANGSKAEDAQLKKTGLSLTNLALAQLTVKDAVTNNTSSVSAAVDTYKAMQAAQDAATGAAQSDVTVTDQLTAAQTAAKNATNLFAQALAGLGNVNLSATQANIAWQQSIADATTALTKNGATLDQSTQAGRDNTTALDTMASSAVALVAAQAKTGMSAADLTANMAAERQSFIETAMKMGDTAAQAGALADKYGLIPANVTTTYHSSGLDTANAAAAALQATLDAIERPFTIPVNIVTTGSLPTAGHLAAVSAAGGFAGAQYRAGGGSIDYRASGGSSFWQPQGTDTIPTMLTKGEFVIKQKSAAYDGHFLSAYNADPARALGAVRGQGGGGAPHITVVIQSKGGVDLSKYIDVRVERAMTGTAVQMQGGATI